MAAGIALNRRRFVGGLSLACGSAMAWPLAAPAQGKLETTSVRIEQDPTACQAPQHVAEDLLRAEGFTDISYIELPSDADVQEAVAKGKADFAMDFALKYVSAIDSGMPLTVLTGVHVGCFELFAHNHIRNIRDLRGKSIGADTMGSSATAFLVSLGAAIGFDAVHEVRWVTEGDPLTRFTKGEIEAFLAHPPEVQQLQSSGVGHVLISSTRDRPWAQYYCCMLGVNNGYLSRHPVATKAVVRAMLRAADICSTDPARAARRIIERRVTEDYDTTVRTLRDIPYGKWRDYSAEDTMRFYALRLHEAGMIRSTPAKIIAKGTDWRFLNEVKRELAG